MGGFLRFLTRTRYHAIGVSTLSLLLPPFSFVGGAVIGLATLRYGPVEGMAVLAGSTVAFALAMWVLAGSIAPAVIFVVVTGLPVLALCALLRTTASQGTVLAAATMAAGGGDFGAVSGRSRSRGMVAGHVQGVSGDTSRRSRSEWVRAAFPNC